ncbi:MAG: hypothetical protein KDJ36_06700 [Hyphomicrobiaceae bacterium]|nr:hypothetical protein [Hyphomicrobiaceae bacterium]
MSLKRPYGTSIIVPALATAIGVVAGAALDNVWVVVVAAIAFAGLAASASWVLNQGFMQLQQSRVTAETGPIAALLNARLMAVVYAWGGLSMLAAYYLTPLSWYHAWQYGGAMVLVAAALHFYAQALVAPRAPARAPRAQLAVERLTVVQGITATAGALAVIVSGKLTTGKPDWVANILFISGGLTIGTLSALAVMTRRRVAGRSSD